MAKQNECTNISTYYYGLQGSASAFFASKVLSNLDNATIICKDKNVAEKFFIDLKF